MRKVAIVTDSIACLTPQQADHYGIEVLPLSFYSAGRHYHDGVDITPTEAYELFLKDPESFRTSSVSPGEFLEAYRAVSKQAEGILCVTISSNLSAVYDAALDAGEMLKEESGDVTVRVLDSQTCAAAEGLIVLAAARAAADGQDLAEVSRVAEVTQAEVGLFAFLDTIRHVYRSGRIPKIASQAGSALNIKPLLTVSSGVLRFVGVVRSRRAGVERLLKELRKRVGQRPAHIVVMHVYAAELAEELRERISSEFNCAELWVAEFSPLMGYVCGTGTLGVAFQPVDQPAG